LAKLHGVTEIAKGLGRKLRARGLVTDLSSPKIAKNNPGLTSLVCLFVKPVQLYWIAVSRGGYVADNLTVFGGFFERSLKIVQHVSGSLNPSEARVRCKVFMTQEITKNESSETIDTSSIERLLILPTGGVDSNLNRSSGIERRQEEGRTREFLSKSVAHTRSTDETIFSNCSSLIVISVKTSTATSGFKLSILGLATMSL
jgi:hypothetical protein